MLEGWHYPSGQGTPLASPQKSWRMWYETGRRKKPDATVHVCVCYKEQSLSHAHAFIDILCICGKMIHIIQVFIHRLFFPCVCTELTCVQSDYSTWTLALFPVIFLLITSLCAPLHCHHSVKQEDCENAVSNNKWIFLCNKRFSLRKADPALAVYTSRFSTLNFHTLQYISLITAQ